MKACYFCNNNQNISKIKLIGKHLGKKKIKTICICLTCDAMSDVNWIAERLDLDQVKKVLPKK